MIRRSAVVLIVVMLAACASARTKSLQVGLRSLNVARDTTRAVADKREGQIYDACNPPTCTKEEGHKQVDEWREKVDVVIKALDVGYQAVFSAFLLKDAKSATDAAAAISKALTLAKDLKP